MDDFVACPAGAEPMPGVVGVKQVWAGLARPRSRWVSLPQFRSRFRLSAGEKECERRGEDRSPHGAWWHPAALPC